MQHPTSTTTTTTTTTTGPTAATTAAAVVERKRMKLMVAVDDSEGSFYALEWTLSNIIVPIQAAGPSPPEDGCFLYLVHVHHPFHRYVLPVAPAVHPVSTASPQLEESVKKSQEETSALLLERALKVCKAKMVRVETLVLEGDPKEMICELSEQMHIDLLVVGSRGMGQIKRALLGSVSDHCAHHAPCPVLIVKPPK